MIRRLRRLHGDDRGEAVEYLLITALVVMPIGALTPMFFDMIRIYTYRIVDIARLPFP